MNSKHDEDTPGHERDEMAEEFRRLLDAAASRADEYLRGLRESNAPEDATASSCSTSCGWCPVCAIGAVLRGERTENTTRLLEQVNAFVCLLRQTLAEHGEQRAGAEDSTAGRADVDQEPGVGGKVQRIEVRRVRGRAGRPAAAGSAADGESPGGRSEAKKRSC